MTIGEILYNEQLRRHEFPVAAESVFLAHGGDCPLPRRVAEAIASYAARCSRGDQEQLVYPQILTRGRGLAAQLLGCAPEEVAFVGPTSLALSFVASGIRLQPGDNVLIYFDDYPANVYPWLALQDQGVEVRLLKTAELGAITPSDVAAQLNEKTKLVALASCHFVSGYRIDHGGIGALLRERNVMFCLDAIQTLGAFPTTVERVDLLAADAHKWLLGPCGAGLMYVRNALQERVTPHIYGWHNVRCPDYIAQDKIVYRRGAKKYEAGTHNLLGLVGLVAGMELILEVGVANIARELLRKRAWLSSALREKGCSVLFADASPEVSSGMLSFCQPGRDPAALHQRLAEAKIITSLRRVRSGQRYVRVSPHFYNTDEELQRLMELL
jgi:selenocysteine lyase/cysteine desulfurase